MEYTGFIVLVFFWYGAWYADWNGDYLDTDNYFHALRVYDMFESGKFAEKVFPFSNYPFGEVLHWTRALDIFWGILTLPFLKFYDLKEAVFYGGMLVAPLLCLVGVWYFVKTGRLILNWQCRILAAVLIFVQSNVIRVVVLNRPDHHAAMFFLVFFLLYQMVSYIQTQERRYITAMAIGTAVSLWLSVEGVFLYFTEMLFLFAGIRCFKYSFADFRRFAGVFAVWISIFFVFNPPVEGYFYMDNGRISLFYVIAGWWAFGAIFAASKTDDWTRQAVVLATASVILWTVYFAGGFLRSPFDKRIIVPFVARISEMESGNIYTLAYPVFGVLVLLYELKKNKCRAVLWLLLSYLGVFGGLSCVSSRFLPYAGVYGAFALALFVQEKIYEKRHALGWAVMFIGLEFAAFVFQIAIGGIKKEPLLYVSPDGLAKLPEGGAVVCDVFLAPYIIWYGNRAVVASPYHRNVEGIWDNHRILFSTDENEVAGLIRKHRVRSVFLLKTSDEAYYKDPLKNCDKLYGKILGCSNYPDWLKVIHNRDYYLFSIDEDKLP